MFYEEWGYVFDADGTVLSRSSTLMEFENLDGTQTRIIGTGLSYDSDGALIDGTITEFNLFDPSTNELLVSYSDMSVSVPDALAEMDVATEVMDLLLPLTDYFDFNEEAVSFSVTSTLAEITGANGNRLQILGTNLESSGDFNVENGLITEMRVLNANGTLLETTGPISFTFLDLVNGFEGEGYIAVMIAGREAGSIFIDEDYNADYQEILIDEGADAKDFDLNGTGFVAID